jgi:DNA polymerase-3 subunit alpha
MQHSDFVHLHLHTQYSLLDGAIRLEPLFKKAAEYKMPSLAITDHGNMFGAVDFYRTAKKHGIKPIIGCEVYVAPTSRLEKSSQEGIADSSYHLILLAKNSTGYKNLVSLVSAGYLEGFYYRPRIDKELLSKHTEGLIALSSCMKGEIQRLLHKGQRDDAYKAASFYKDVMGERRFYLEIQDQNIPDQKDINRDMLDMAKKLSIPLVATNDCHYMDEKDAEAHEVLLCIQTGKTTDDPKRMRFTTNQFYFKSPQEMKLLFKEAPEAVSNTIEIAERCNLDMRFDQIHLPHYNVPSDTTLDGYLSDMAKHGLESRIKQWSVVSGQWSEEKREIYFRRLEDELKMIKAMGYSGYFLIVWDFIDYARRKGIPVGPGRGSAAGSLVAYALRITDLDPIKYGLLFERFLNPERISMPDIDIDFCMERRDEVIAYVTEKYGNVAQIITFGSMNAKAVIRDVGRAMAMPYSDADRIAKLVPNRLNITLDDAIKEEPRFKEMEKKDERVKRLLDIARRLEGLPRHASTHAAGVVISPAPLMEFMPLYKASKGEITTQYPMEDIEKLGLLKMDFLGLRTLTVIRRSEELIRKSPHKVDFSIESIPLNDKDTYKLLSDARTFGVFQLESSGLRDILRKLKPEAFEDVIALVALYRPGPLGSGMVDDFIKRKHGTVPIKNIVPQLDDILKETYGVILYQEQVMKIASVLGGFSMGAADLLRRAMGKKKPEEMAQQREKFVKGAVANRIPQDKADKIFDLMEHFAGYGFNKSHSAAYALVAYQTAYLKSHYPLEFMSSLLSSEMGNTDKMIQYIAECKDMGIQMLPPDINESFSDFTVVYEGENPPSPPFNKGGRGGVRFGLAAVKNVGGSAVEAILKVRKIKGSFSSLMDFCENVDLRVVNRKVIESLVKCGAFDGTAGSIPPFKKGGLGGVAPKAHRAKMINNLDAIMGSAQTVQRDREKGQYNMFDNSFINPPAPPFNKGGQWGLEWSEKELLSYEKESLGFYISGHPLSRFEKEIRHFTNVNTQTLQDIKNGREISIAGVISKYRTQVTKKGDTMAFATLEDLHGSVEMIVFPDVYKTSVSLIEGEEPVLIKGNISAEDDSTKIIAKEIFPLSNISERLSSKVHINIQAVGLEKDTLIRLKEILSASKGRNNLFLHLFFPDKSQINIGVDKTFQVTPDDSMIKEIESLFGDDVVYFE